MDEAVNDCDRALRINERSLNAVLYKAEAMCGLGQTEAAKELLVTALEAHPDQTKRVQGIHSTGHVVHWPRGNVVTWLQFYNKHETLYR